MGIGANVKKLAQKSEISLKELSRLAGMPYTTLYNMVKRDSSRVSPENVQKLANALGVGVGEIYGLDSVDKILKLADSDEAKEIHNIARLAAQKANIKEQQKKLEAAFSKLNSVGREEAIKRTQELARLSKYSYNEHDEVEWAEDVLEDMQNAAGDAPEDTDSKKV